MKRTTRATAVCLFAVLASACATVPPEEDPVLIKLNELDRRLAAVERVVQNDSLVQLVTRVDALQAEQAELRGMIEELAHDAESTAGRQRDLYVDLDQRLQRLEQSGQGDGGGLAPGELPMPSGSDRDNYQAAFELLKDGRYDEAATAFTQFLKTYRDSGLADNAQYWLAESYYVTQQFEAALPAFETVVSDYPRSGKVPDALLKIGYCNYELQRWDAARDSLNRVRTQYPDTTAARLAIQRLERMDTENR
jgi:tol-pal system protein YbgF